MLIAVLACASGPAIARLQSQQGVARDPDGGSLLYREQHLIERDDDGIRRRLVLYRCADGTAFARKRVDYAASRFAPDFSLIDARDGYREGLRRQEDGRKPDQREVWSGRAATPVPLPAHEGILVADAGFDEFVRARWSVLMQVDKLPIRFVVPAYAKSLGFNVRRLGAGTVAGKPAQRFSLKLGGLLSLVSPEIEVDYDDGSHRLLRFEGVSNLRNDQGKPMAVRIDFPDASRPAPQSQWQQMREAPLQACRIGA